MASPITRSGELKCKLCLAVYRSPRLLPCHHTFCVDCLDRWIQLFNDQAFSCPVCGILILVPSEGASGFRIDYIMETELKRTSQGLCSVMCAVHPVLPMVSFCVTCQQAICISCKLIKHNHHCVEDLSEYLKRNKKGDLFSFAVWVGQSERWFQTEEKRKKQTSEDAIQIPPPSKQPVPKSLQTPAPQILTESPVPSSCTTSTQTEGRKTPVPPPIVCPEWSVGVDFTSEGGCLQTEGSDVLLRVPSGAVESGDSVHVLASVCANVDRIRHILHLPEDELIVSPLAEYRTRSGFHFQRLVDMTLPCALSPGYDFTLVNVYRVSLTDQGSVAITKVPFKETPPDHSDLDSCFFDSQPHSVSPLFYFTSPREVCILTDRFSAYVCTYSDCSLQQDCPVLHVMVCSSRSRDEDGEQVIIYTYIWDDRLNIKDFRKGIGFGEDKKIHSTAVLPLMEEVGDSELRLCLQLTGKGARHWMRMHGGETCADALFPFRRTVDIQQVLSCNNTSCSARKMCSQPVVVVWALETVDDCPSQASPTLRCVVRVSHQLGSMPFTDECFVNTKFTRTLFVEVKGDMDSCRQSGKCSFLSGMNTKPWPLRQDMNRPHAGVQARRKETEDEDGYNLSSDDDNIREACRGIHKFPNIGKYEADESSSGSITKIVNWPSDYPNNKADATNRCGNGNISQCSDSSFTDQRGMMSRKRIIKTDPNVLSRARDKRPTEIKRTEQKEKTLIIHNISSSSDTLQNFNPYSSSSETDVKCVRQFDGKYGGSESALSEDHYEEIASPTISACPPHLAPCLSDESSSATTPTEPDREQTTTFHPHVYHQPSSQNPLKIVLKIRASSLSMKMHKKRHNVHFQALPCRMECQVQQILINIRWGRLLCPTEGKSVIQTETGYL